MSTPTLRNVNQPGLDWNRTLFGQVARWTKEPSTDIMQKLIVQHLKLNDEPQVFFFAAGALNKLYAFDCAKGRFLMRIALPAAPKVKTESEVATLILIRENTSIPVPRVVAFNSDLNNELGFEWLIMDRVDAQPLLHVWHDLSWLKKQLLVQQIATFYTQLFDLRLHEIGSICLPTTVDNRRAGTHSHRYPVGEIVLPYFFIDDTIKLDIDRGPYNSSRNYLNACVDIMRHHTTKYLSSDDEDDIEHGQDMREVCVGLEAIIPRYFQHHSYCETTRIYHRDLSFMNILVDSNGNLSSIVDWECVVAIPVWQACTLPQLLKGRPYALSDVPPAMIDQADADSINYGKENLANYELAQLRGFFLEEMQRLSPEWMETFRRERVRNDIALAVEYSSSDVMVKWVKAWLKVLVQGDEPKTSLADGCRSGEARENADWIWD